VHQGPCRRPGPAGGRAEATGCCACRARCPDPVPPAFPTVPRPSHTARRPSPLPHAGDPPGRRRAPAVRLRYVPRPHQAGTGQRHDRASGRQGSGPCPETESGTSRNASRTPTVPARRAQSLRAGTSRITSRIALARAAWPRTSARGPRQRAPAAPRTAAVARASGRGPQRRPVSQIPGCDPMDRGVVKAADSDRASRSRRCCSDGSGGGCWLTAGGAAASDAGEEGRLGWASLRAELSPRTWCTTTSTACVS
jgi:hypothetical protein